MCWYPQSLVCGYKCTASGNSCTHTVSPLTDFESAQVRRTWWIFQEFQGTYFLPFFSEKAPIHDTIFDFRTYLRLEIRQTNVVEKSFSLCGQSFKNGRLKTTAFGKQRHIKNGSTQQRTFFYYLTVWRPAIIQNCHSATLLHLSKLSKGKLYLFIGMGCGAFLSPTPPLQLAEETAN